MEGLAVTFDRKWFRLQVSLWTLTTTYYRWIYTTAVVILTKILQFTFFTQNKGLKYLTGFHFYDPKKGQKPLVFWRFQGV